MNSQFAELVRTLEPVMLDELRRAVATELSQRRAESAIHIESISPSMIADQKAQAMQEIARALKGEEGNA